MQNQESGEEEIRNLGTTAIDHGADAKKVLAAVRTTEIVLKEIEKSKTDKCWPESRADLSTTYLPQIEYGERNPSLEALCRLCSALQVDLTDLVKAGSRQASL